MIDSSIIASGHEKGTILRASGGAKVILWNSKTQWGNKAEISLGGMPFVCGLVGFNQKSYQSNMPRDFNTRRILAAMVCFTCGLRIEEKAVNCNTRSNELEGKGSICPSAQTNPDRGNLYFASVRRG